MLASSDVLLTLSRPLAGTPGTAALIAGLRLRASQTIPALPALRPSPFAFSVGYSSAIFAPTDVFPVLSLTTLVADTPTEVTCHVAPAGITVHATGFGEVFIAADGCRLTWHPSDDLARQRPELILGPGLVLALALQQVFCLHSSAVLGPEGAVLFSGDSGAGKSTLAARLSALHGYQRLTDDITPFTASASECSLLPHFPQLKLPPESQHPADAPERYPIARLYLLSESPADAPVRDEPVSPSVAALSVCRHAVASRLFPESLMARLLHASTALVENVEVRHLHYPKRPGSIADVARLLGTP